MALYIQRRNLNKASIANVKYQDVSQIAAPATYSAQPASTNVRQQPQKPTGLLGSVFPTNTPTNAEPIRASGALTARETRQPQEQGAKYLHTFTNTPLTVSGSGGVSPIVGSQIETNKLGNNNPFLSTVDPSLYYNTK